MIEALGTTQQQSDGGLRSVIAVLDANAPSFCHYANADANAKEPRWMGLDVLRETLRFAAAKKLRVVCLVGRRSIPPKHAAMLRRASCALIRPLESKAHLAKAERRPARWALAARDCPVKRSNRVRECNFATSRGRARSVIYG